MTKLYNKKHLIHFRRSLRDSMPRGEVLLWKYLKKKQLGYKFRRQFSIENYILDFYCPMLRVAIEVDGYTHLDYDQYKHDMKRQEYIEDIGITVLRFTSKEVFESIEHVIEYIIEICEKIDSV